MKISIPLMILIVTPSSTVLADVKNYNWVPNFSLNATEISTSIGILNGKSHEFVYDVDTGKKISQLDWELKNSTILKGEFSWDAYSYLTFNARGWTTLSSGSAYMNDYDWADQNKSGWTDHSKHPDTTLNYGNEFDLSLTGWIYNTEMIKFGAVGGYQETRFSWTSQGGSYNYKNGTVTGNFPDDMLGVGYSQLYKMPYVGIKTRYSISDYEFNALFKFSDWVRASDNDEHYARGLTFRENTRDSRYYGISFDAGYFLTESTKVFVEYAYNNYDEGKGSSQAIDNSSGESSTTQGNAAGLSNVSHLISAGILYRF